MKTLNVLTITTIISLSFCAGCTKPGETTGIGAATGGALGAGLGAIVGNQTGNPGSGLAIGAAAGASAGALVANALESQQKTVQQQDEALERQEATLQAQKSEIEELRRGGADYRARPSLQKSPSSLAPGDLYGAPIGAGKNTNEAVFSEKSVPVRRSIEKVASGDLYLSAGSSTSVAVPHKNIESISVASDQSIEQSHVSSQSEYIEAPVPSKTSKESIAEKASLNTDKAGRALKKASDDTAESVIGNELADSETSILETDIPVSAASLPSEAVPAAEKINLSDTKPLSEVAESQAPSETVDIQKKNTTEVSAINLAPAKECKGANAEVSKAKAAKDSGDKLFHYRRALRICPDDALIHKELGALYASLGRKEDAVFEYQEALKSNPGDEDAKSKISELK